jgi:hypothetical protein
MASSYSLRSSNALPRPNATAARVDAERVVLGDGTHVLDERPVRFADPPRHGVKLERARRRLHRPLQLFAGLLKTALADEQLAEDDPFRAVLGRQSQKPAKRGFRLVELPLHHLRLGEIMKPRERVVGHPAQFAIDGRRLRLAVRLLESVGELCEGLQVARPQLDRGPKARDRFRKAAALCERQAELVVCLRAFRPMMGDFEERADRLGVLPGLPAFLGGAGQRSEPLRRTGHRRPDVRDTCQTVAERDLLGAAVLEFLAAAAGAGVVAADAHVAASGSIAASGPSAAGAFASA